MKTTKKEIPEFQNEEEERDFWGDHDSVDYIDWDEGKVGRFPKLKPSTKSISIRLPESLIEDLKILANKRDVPYQSLLKVYLAERVAAEFDKKKEENRVVFSISFFLEIFLPGGRIDLPGSLVGAVLLLASSAYRNEARNARHYAARGLLYDRRLPAFSLRAASIR